MPTLNWIGKDKVINHHMDVPFKVLEHSYGFDNGTQTNTETKSGNKIIHGDNLEALKALLPEYEGKIKCIYIDPPYNTGNENWIYNDNVNDSKIKKWLNQVVGIDDLTRHDKWLCMMYPRLKILNKLLSKDGIILISIGDDELHNLIMICNEIFGEKSHDATFVWKSRTKPTNAGRSKYRPQKVTEYVLLYSKTKDILFNTLTGEDNYSYPNEDADGKFRTTTILTSNLGTYKRETMRFEIAGFTPSTSQRWKAGEKIIQDLFDNNRLQFNDGIPMEKVYENDNEEINNPLYTIIRQELSGTAESGKSLLNKIIGMGHGFDTVKPIELLNYLLSVFTEKNSIVLDSFAGTGTTAHAVLNLNDIDKGNRKFILIEMEDYAEKITAERIKKVIQGYDYSGNKKFELSSYSINLKTLKRGNQIIDDYMKFKEDVKYSKVNIEPGNGKILITGTEKITERVDDIKGEFDFYKVGQPLFMEDGNLNELISSEEIRQYIYYTETKNTLIETKHKDNKYFLGKNDDTCYYFNYEQNKVTTLDHAFLATIKTKAEQYVIYADNCLLTKNFMTKNHIIFKKIPRDITRF